MVPRVPSPTTSGEPMAQINVEMGVSREQRA
jgi:hypothetical protein